MSDLVEQLQNVRCEGIEELCWKAAAEIEQLRQRALDAENALRSHDIRMVSNYWYKYHDPLPTKDCDHSRKRDHADGSAKCLGCGETWPVPEQDTQPCGHDGFFRGVDSCLVCATEKDKSND